MKRFKITMITLFAVRQLLFTASAQTDSLSHYLKIAGENNPALQSALHLYEAALQSIPQAGALQDPQLETGFFLQPMELMNGRQIAEFKLMQMFPWFGTRKAARTEAQHMAQMAFEQFRETGDQLRLDIYTQWYILCRLQQQLKNNRENRRLLLQLEELAMQKFKAPLRTSPSGMSGQQSGNAQSPAAAVSAGMGGGMSMGSIPSATASPEAMSQAASMEEASSSGMSEVLRIRLEMAETDSNMESLLSEIQAEKARFNALLNRPADSGVTLPDSLLQTPYSLDMETAMQLVSAQNPMLGMIGEERLAYRAKEEMTRKMGYPMFGVGLQYMLIGKTPQSDSMSGMNGMNGKDMLMPMLSVTIPVYRRKYRAAQNESRLLRLSSEEKYADTFNRLQAELHRYRHQLDDASRKITLYRKQTEIARAAYAMMVQAFAAGKSGLDEVIRIQRQILDYELKISEAVAAYNTLTAQIYKMMSRQDSNNP